MNYYVVLFLFLCLVSAAVRVENSETNRKVINIKSEEIHIYEPTPELFHSVDGYLRTYCYNGETKTLGRLFETAELILNIKSDNFRQYDGATAAEVKEHYDDHRSFFSFNIFSQKRTRLQLSPFTPSCMGIEASESYSIRLQRVRVDFWLVIQLIFGCLLFHYAGKFSQNALFYYITGVTLGICCSFMLLIWLAGKLFPRGVTMYAILAGGWTIGIYIIQMLWENLQVLILSYRTYVFWYIFITGTMSFFFCYRWGPPSNKRSRDIIKWILQLTSLVMIYFSSYYEEATTAIIILTIILHYFPPSLLYKARAFWLRKFPPTRRLITSEEYYEQGVRETTKALEELRKFASSPDCKQWRIMSKLRDPMRFAAFVEGASHLRDEEILYCDSSKTSDDLSDDNEDEMEINKVQHYNKSYYNGCLDSNDVGDISEDDEDLGEENNSIRARVTPLCNINFTPSTTSHIRTRRSTPTVRTRLSSSAPRSVTRSSQQCEQDFSDEA